MYIIYKATHIPTGKIYVGQTSKPLSVRIGQHWANERKPTKFTSYLHSTKMEEWSWETIQVVLTYSEARDCEMYHIRLWDLYNTGLNSSTGGLSEEDRKISGARLKAYRAENPAPWNKGRTQVYSEETLEKMRLAKLRNPSRPKYTEEDKLKKSIQASNNKQIVELKSGVIYHSISHAARELGLRREAVRDVVKGRRSHTAGLVFKEVENETK